MIHINNNYTEDIPKYKKKSNKSRLKRSKHKHNYKDGWLHYPFLLPWKNETVWHFSKIKYCDICGYVGNSDDCLFDKIMIKDDDIVFDTDEHFGTKFVDLNKGYKYKECKKI